MNTRRRFVQSLGLGAVMVALADMGVLADRDNKGGYCAFCNGHGECHSRYCNQRTSRCMPNGNNPCSGYRRHRSFQCRHGKKNCCIPRTNTCVLV